MPPPPASDAGIPVDSGAIEDVGGVDRSLGIAAVGESGRLEIATWNLRDFPIDGEATVNTVAGILQDLQLDIVALQEITDMGDFQRLLLSLDEFDGVLNPDHYSNGTYQKTGIIYRRSRVSIGTTRELFNGEEYPFPRSPLEAEVEVTDPVDTATYSLTLIVVHLKAGTEDESHDRRSEACRLLKEHVDAERLTAPGRDFLVLGDFNARLTGPYRDVFDPFTSDANTYRFLTLELAEDGEWSLPTYGIMIDHMLVAEGGALDFVDDRTQVLHLDELLPGYTETVSDHRPVVTSIVPVTWR